MVWRSIMISQPAKLGCEHHSLTIQQQEITRIPFEDIAVIILDHQQILLTHPVLSVCAEHGISLFSTGQDHLPNGVFLAFLQHSRTTKYLRLQQNLKKPLIKQLWAVIIQAKLTNQAKCLQLIYPRKQQTIAFLLSLAKKVRSGDPDNLEAQGAVRYFTALFNPKFKRKDQHIINAALNYGYAVLRGTIARSIVAHGLLPAFGLFHHNEQNAFNLADDLIEPFRPQVDLWVAEHMLDTTEANLNTRHKAELAGLLHVDIQMPNGTMTVLSAIEQTVSSLVRCFETSGIETIKLPNLIGVNQHHHE